MIENGKLDLGTLEEIAKRLKAARPAGPTEFSFMKNPMLPPGYLMVSSDVWEYLQRIGIIPVEDAGDTAGSGVVTDISHP